MKNLTSVTSGHPHPYLTPLANRHASSRDPVLGETLPLPSPEQQQASSNLELVPGSGMTISGLQELSLLDGKAQTNVASKPNHPAAVLFNDQSKSKARYFRFVALYEDDYRVEILAHMYKMQGLMPSRSSMQLQSEIKWDMRSSLVHMIRLSQRRLRLSHETFYLSVNVLDRYCSVKQVKASGFKLLAFAAFLIAAKYEGASDSEIEAIMRSATEEHRRGVVLKWERHVFDTINHELGYTTAEAWFRGLTHSIDHTGSTVAEKTIILEGWAGIPETKTYGVPVVSADSDTQEVGRFFMEITTHIQELIDVVPSVIAEAALILAKVVTQQTRERARESDAAIHVAEFLHNFVARFIDSIYSTFVRNDACELVYRFYSNCGWGDHPEVPGELEDATGPVAQPEVDEFKDRKHTAPPVSSPVREETVSPVCGSNRDLKGGALVQNSTTSTVKGGEDVGMSAEQAEEKISASQNTQDTFKSLARSARRSKPGRRKASVASVDSFLPIPATVPKPSTGKRAREGPAEDDSPTPVDLSPPPSKKHRREDSASAAVQTMVVSKAGKPPVTAPTVPKHQVSGLLASSKATILEDIGLGEGLIWVQEDKKRKETEAKVISQASSPPSMAGGPPLRPTHSSLLSRGRKRPPPAIDDEEPGVSHKCRRLEVPSKNNSSSSKPFINHISTLSIPVNDNEGNRLDIGQQASKKLKLILDFERLGGKAVSAFGDLVQWGGRISEKRDSWVWNYISGILQTKG